MSYSYSKRSLDKTPLHPAMVHQVLVQNEWLNALCNSLSDALFVVDLKGLVLFRNKVARTYTTTERHKDISHMVHPSSLAYFLKDIIKRKKLYFKEYFSVHTNALFYEYHISSFPLAIRGVTKGYALQIQNISQDRRADQEKEQQHSIRLLSNVANELIHEIKNPLGAMSLHVQLLRRKLVKDDLLSSSDHNSTNEFSHSAQQKNNRIHKKISQATLNTLIKTLPVLEQEINTINVILNNLQNHSSTPSYDMHAMDINILVKELVEVLSLNTTYMHIRLRVTMAPSLPKVLLSHSGIMQVLYNLTKNAIESMQEKQEREELHYGEVEYIIPKHDKQGQESSKKSKQKSKQRPQQSPQQRPQQKLEPEAQPNQEPEGELSITTRLCENRVCLIISDTGIGIKEDDLPYVFQPYYTTKAKGTGLGLSIVFRIIMLHGAHITVDKQYRKGARFIIEFPVHADEHHLLKAAS